MKERKQLKSEIDADAFLGVRTRYRKNGMLTHPMSYKRFEDEVLKLSIELEFIVAKRAFCESLYIRLQQSLAAFRADQDAFIR